MKLVATALNPWQTTEPAVLNREESRTGSSLFACILMSGTHILRAQTSAPPLRGGDSQPRSPSPGSGVTRRTGSPARSQASMPPATLVAFVQPLRMR